MAKEFIRCMDCTYFKPIGRGLLGWCKDNREGRKSIRVNAVGRCSFAVKKSQGGGE